MTATTGHERAFAFLDGGNRNLREITTPEGVPLVVEVASFGERATAFVLDLLLWFAATALCYALLVLVIIRNIWTHDKATVDVVLAILLLLAFLIRNLYFIHFELAWQGATPGKRAIGLRVIDRRGGPLLPSAVFARNLTREVETFMPLTLLIAVGFGMPLWEGLSVAAWALAFAALPLFNRDRLRGGDLIAGTMVIVLPRRLLLADLVERTSQYRFTERQLDAYGAFELQALEELLRRAEAPHAARLRGEVRDKICRKIGWTTPPADAETLIFLRDFYRAQRAYLEREQLLGRPRADKHHQRTAKAE